MSESTKRAQGRPASEESRAALLDAAYWRLIEHGYDALTVDSIAKPRQPASRRSIAAAQKGGVGHRGAGAEDVVRIFLREHRTGIELHA
jgi:coproporphyrinogen III oxidase-like Fe-S oxidoreductase